VGHRLLLDKHDIGSADDRPVLPTIPGAHRLALVDASGRVVDQVLFTVR
jgi:penicillin-binding protein 1C